MCNCYCVLTSFTFVLMVDSADECVYEKCAIGSTFVPRLSGKFFATENFFYTSQVFRIYLSISIAIELQENGFVEHLCLKAHVFVFSLGYMADQFFGLVPKATLADFQHAGVQYCEDNWRTLQQKHEGVSKEDLLKYCFSSAYIVAFLHDSLGVPMDDER